MDFIPNLLTRIVIAEFDIDKGSCIRTQYPPAGPSPDDGYIAEQLLPDGSEKHSLGRSFIVLGHRKPSSSFSVATQHVRNMGAYVSEMAAAGLLEQQQQQGQDPSAASAPSPLPALEDILTIDKQHVYVRRLGEVLKKVCHADCSVSVAQKSICAEWGSSIVGLTLTFTPSQALLSKGGDVAWEGAKPSTIDILVSPSVVDQLKRLLDEYHGVSGPTAASETAPNPYPCPLFAVAATMTKKDSTVRRGGITKGVAFIGPDLVQLSALWPSVELLVKRCCDVKGTDQAAIDAQFEIIKGLYTAIAAEVRALALGSNALGHLIASAATEKEIVDHESASAFTGSESSPYLAMRATNHGQMQTVRIQNPLISGTDPIDLPAPKTPAWFMPLSTFGVAEVLVAFKENFAAILTALLCGRRIVVKGFGCPSTVVSEAALAIGIIGSCIVPDFITTRVFPYSSITFMDKFMGLGAPYVVGTLNPMFDSRSEWWDLLCDLDTGNVTAGISTRMLTSDAPFVEKDKDFCRQLMQYLSSQGGYLGHSRNVVEQGVRERIAEYIATVMTAAAHADHTSKMTPALRALLELNHKRLMLTQLGGLFDTFVDKHIGGGDIGRVELQLAVASLRRCEEAADDDIIQSLQTILRRVEAGSQGPHNLLSLLPQATGGIAPVANQLLSTNMAVRVIALEVLSRLEKITLGKKSMGCLNSFVLLAYEQLRADMAVA